MVQLKRTNIENPGELHLQPYLQALPTVSLKRLDINSTGERYLGV